MVDVSDQRITPVTPASESPPVIRLKRNAVGLWEGVSQSFSFVSPAGNVAILLVGTAAFSMGSMPLAVAIAWIIYLLWMVVPNEFSREIVNAGSYYAYSAQGLGGGGGVLALWMWMGENLTGPAFGVLGLSGFIYLLSSSLSKTGWAWVPLAVLTLLFGVILSYTGIRASLRYTLWSAVLEVLFLVISAIIIIVKVGPNNSLAPFTLQPVHGAFSPFFLGVVFSVLDFTGLGTATTVSEETTGSKRVISKAILIAWVISGLAIVLPSYALTVGWGLPNMANYAKSPDPGLIVFQRYLGTTGWILLILFTINSYLMYMVAKVNAVTRIWYSAGRDGIIFKRFAKIHPRLGTPHTTVVLFFVVILVVNVITASILGPTNGALWLLTISGVCIIGVHIVANTALTAYFWKKGKFRVALHGIIPTVATIIGLVVLWYSVYPIPAEPFGSAVVIGLIWLVLAFIVSLYYAKRHRHVIAKAGMSQEEA